MAARISVLLVLILGGFLFAASNETMVCDFETAESLSVWEEAPQIMLTPDHATQGKAAGQMKLVSPLKASSIFPRDWSAYKALASEVTAARACKLKIIIADKNGKEYVVKERKVPAGLYGLVIDLVDVSVQLDMPNITRFEIIPLEGAPELVMDNLRFIHIAPPRERKLMDFENPLDITFFEVSRGNVSISNEHVTSGSRALKVEPDTYLVGWKFDPLWSGFDTFEVDFFNDTGAPVPLSLLVADKPWIDSLPKGMSFWNRHNSGHQIPPGKWTFSVSASGLYRGEAGSRFNDIKTCIDPGSIVRVDLGIGKARAGATGAVYMDNIRLYKAFIPQGVMAFDFGPESQVMQPGFISVHHKLVYNKDTGYGLKRELHPNRGRDDTFPSKLYRDYLLLQQQDGGEFMVDLPNGVYHVWFAFDDPGYWGGEVARHTKRAMIAEGQEVWAEDRGELSGYKHANHLFEEIEPLPGADFWTLYMSKLFQPHSFKVQVSDGQLNMFIKADAWWSGKMAGMIIYPDGLKDIGKAFVKETVQTQKDEFTVAAVEYPLPAGGSLDDIPAREKAKGYVFFLTDYEKETYLTTIPSPDQIKRSKAIFAAPGEYEPVTFAVRPLKAMGQARVTVSDFAGPNGAAIPASAWRLDVVRHLSRRGFSAIAYKIIPQMLRPFERIDLPAGLTREFWATVKVPANTAPGEYQGSISIISDAGLKETIKVDLTILPVKLDGSEYVFGFFGNPPTEQVGRLLVDYGINSFSGGPGIALKGWDAEGNPQLDFSRTDAFMIRTKKAGFTQELCGYGGPSISHIGYYKDEAFFGKWEKETGKSYVELLRSAFDAMKEHAEENDWLPFTYNLCDEPRNPDTARKLVLQINAIQEAAPWLKTTGQYSASYRNGLNPKDYHQWVFEALKTSGLNSHDDSVMARARETGKEVYIYNQGQSRYSFGAYQWSEYTKGVRGRYQWHQHVQHGYQYFDLDGREPDTGVLYYGMNGPIPTLALERCREGADDFYYCQTLWNLTEKNSSATAKEARAWLKGLIDPIKISQRSAPEGFSNDELRKGCARYILLLTGGKVPKALEK